MGFTAYGNFNGGFRGPETQEHLCGRPLNVYDNGYAIKQAKIPTTLTEKDILAALPVQLDNRVGAPGTNGLAGMNADVLEVTGLGTTTANIGGFALVGPVDAVDVDGGDGYCHIGGLVNVGYIGSGVEVYLPASSDCANIATTTGLIWDATNAELDVKAAEDTALAIHFIGALVDGYKLKKNATSGLVEWVATKCIRCKL